MSDVKGTKIDFLRQTGRIIDKEGDLHYEVSKLRELINSMDYLSDNTTDKEGGNSHLLYITHGIVFVVSMVIGYVLGGL